MTASPPAKMGARGRRRISCGSTWNLAWTSMRRNTTCLDPPRRTYLATSQPTSFTISLARTRLLTVHAVMAAAIHPLLRTSRNHGIALERSFTRIESALRFRLCATTWTATASSTCVPCPRARARALSTRPLLCVRTECGLFHLSMHRQEWRRPPISRRAVGGHRAAQEHAQAFYVRFGGGWNDANVCCEAERWRNRPRTLQLQMAAAT